ncbi:hypothetical protein [Streptomyces goshikiensis]
MDMLSAAADFVTVLASALSIALELRRARAVNRTNDNTKEEEN